nr:uncharacterized protein LOC108015461 isoform X3 [Drosophila suzukii]
MKNFKCEPCPGIPGGQSLTGTSCSWENSSFGSDDADLRAHCGVAVRSQNSHRSRGKAWMQSCPSRDPQIEPSMGIRSEKIRVMGAKRFNVSDAFQSISTWKYTELIQDNLTMALVDELHDDGCLLRERWDEIEARLADMVPNVSSRATGPKPVVRLVLRYPRPPSDQVRRRLLKDLPGGLCSQN